MNKNTFFINKLLYLIKQRIKNKRKPKINRKINLKTIRMLCVNFPFINITTKQEIIILQFNSIQLLKRRLSEISDIYVE